MLPEKFKVLVLTLSDRASRGEYDDLSGPVIMAEAEDVLTQEGWLSEIDYRIIPDDSVKLKELMINAIAGIQYYIHHRWNWYWTT